jgi:hypothetical protein
VYLVPERGEGEYGGLYIMRCMQPPSFGVHMGCIDHVARPCTCQKELQENHIDPRRSRRYERKGKIGSATSRAGAEAGGGYRVGAEGGKYGGLCAIDQLLVDVKSGLAYVIIACCERSRSTWIFARCDTLQR